MAENRLFDILLSLPLFLGMSHSDLHEVAGKTRLTFKSIRRRNYRKRRRTMPITLLSSHRRNQSHHRCRRPWLQYRRRHICSRNIPTRENLRTQPKIYPYVYCKNRLQYHATRKAGDTETFRIVWDFPYQLTELIFLRRLKRSAEEPYVCHSKT